MENLIDQISWLQDKIFLRGFVFGLVHVGIMLIGFYTGWSINRLLKIVSNGVNTMRNSERSIVIVTHYQRLLNYIVPDFVHVLSGGRIVKSGGKELALELEEKGYSWIDGVAAPVGA